MDAHLTEPPTDAPQVADATAKPSVFEPPASSFAEARECGLTELMIADLSTYGGFEDVAATVAAARDGNRPAQCRLAEWRVLIGLRNFCDSWAGSDPISVVNGALSAELNRLTYPKALSCKSNKLASAQPPQFTPPAEVVDSSRTGPHCGPPPGASLHNSRTQPSMELPATSPLAAVGRSFVANIGSTQAQVPVCQCSPAPATPHPHDSSPTRRPVPAFVRRQPVDRWYLLARKADYPVKTLPKSHQEILGVLDRVIVQGDGWGPTDPQRGRHKAINLIPSKLKSHGLKRCERTYQRAIRNLVLRGLITHVATEIDRTGVYAPVWWPVDSTEAAVEIWRKIANGAFPQPKMSDQ